MEHKISSITGDDYTLRCAKCYEDKPLEIIPHRAESEELNGVVGMVFACKDCKEAIYGSKVEIHFK